MDIIYIWDVGTKKIVIKSLYIYICIYIWDLLKTPKIGSHRPKPKTEKATAVIVNVEKGSNLTIHFIKYV